MFKDKIKNVKRIPIYLKAFGKWLVIAVLIGLFCGLIGSIFRIGIDSVTMVRESHDFLILLLPFGGLVIPALYRLCKVKKDYGTNLVFDMVRSTGRVPLNMSFLIFVSTIITHLFGGSAGREGAALQLGGSLGTMVGRVTRLDEKDMHFAVMCGMSGLFAAIFGTPMTAAFFALEVISVGIMYYSALFPCIISSVVAFLVSLAFKIEPVRFMNFGIDGIEIEMLLKIAGLAALCAVVSIVFCLMMTRTGKLFSKLIKNDYLRVIVFGGAIVALTLIVGCTDYNGSGVNIISDAISGTAKPEAFILKIVFTAITIGAGFKGGEIVPAFFVGATFGCVVGPLLGLDPGFAAAVGLVAVFCGATNCPIASIILSIELFGASGIIYFCIACAISYMLSGYYSLYSSQKIVYSKIKGLFVNRDTH